MYGSTLPIVISEYILCLLAVLTAHSVYFPPVRAALPPPNQGVHCRICVLVVLAQNCDPDNLRRNCQQTVSLTASAEELEELDRNVVCSELLEAISCFRRRGAGCSFTLTLMVVNLKRRRESLNCTDSPTTIPPPPPTEEPTDSSECSLIRNMALLENTTFDPIVSIPQSMSYRTNPPLAIRCPLNVKNTELKFCSYFSFSHLSSFSSDEISTCFTPGKWYLMKFPGVLEVMVDNVVPRKSAAETVTQINEISVKFYSNACHEEKLFKASIGAFPVTFADATTSSSDGMLRVEASYSEAPRNGSALIRSFSYNVTISIRLAKGHFVVTIQAPPHLLHKDSGLCNSGCPAHARLVQMKTFISDLKNLCPTNYIHSLLQCSSREHVFNNFQLRGPPFLYEICQFDISKSADFEMVQLSKLAGEDAILMGAVTPPPTTSRHHLLGDFTVEIPTEQVSTDSIATKPKSSTSSTLLTSVNFVYVFIFIIFCLLSW